ncbi:Uncharacterised protein [Serratia rubidaea]|uniref:Uncharacterized protein n=1 Tax=Serratia rubidaea TaxID=61652 RepID=A0A3S4FS24_SERRU|nr:Uncharacterised protein [Serratia rubidaea]
MLSQSIVRRSGSRSMTSMEAITPAATGAGIVAANT